MANADNFGAGAADHVDMMVQVSEGHDVSVVAQRLREAGVEVERELPRTGIVGGKGPRALIARLGAIPGVKRVRTSEPFQLPPFSDEIPQ
jgi:hypothetical protein